MLKNDMDVFFDDEDIAETAVYNGKEIKVIEDGGIVQSTSVPGISLPQITVYIRESDVSQPKQGDRMQFRNKSWYVAFNPLYDGGLWTVSFDQEMKHLYAGF